MLKVRIIENSWLAKLIGYNITLYPFILLIKDFESSCRNHMIHHEWVHVMQVRSFGFFSFYSSYLLEGLAHLIRYKNRNSAYRSISYEKEAYGNQWRVDSRAIEAELGRPVDDSYYES